MRSVVAHLVVPSEDVGQGALVLEVGGVGLVVQVSDGALIRLGDRCQSQAGSVAVAVKRVFGTVTDLMLVLALGNDHDAEAAALLG